MEEKYLEILRHHVNPNDCKDVIQQLLNLHSVSGRLPTTEQIREKYPIDRSKPKKDIVRAVGQQHGAFWVRDFVNNDC